MYRVAPVMIVTLLHTAAIEVDGDKIKTSQRDMESPDPISSISKLCFPRTLDSNFRHWIMLGIQSVNFSARKQNSRGQDCIVDISFVARIPFAI